MERGIECLTEQSDGYVVLPKPPQMQELVDAVEADGIALLEQSLNDKVDRLHARPLAHGLMGPDGVWRPTRYPIWASIRAVAAQRPARGSFPPPAAPRSGVGAFNCD